MSCESIADSESNGVTADGPRIALTTYSVKPRGGVVHTIELAEALRSMGVDVTVVAMGDPDVGFFRHVSAPTCIIPAPEWGDTLEDRVFRWIGAMSDGLDRLQDRFDVIHSQDCISARAAATVRDAGARFDLVRTVHHVDDFTTQALMDCQRQAILEPDHLLVVSELWRKQLEVDYGVTSTVVPNGVRADRFARPISDGRRAELRRQVGAEDRFFFLAVGGIEPRKGSAVLVDALGRCKEAGSDAMVAVIGGHSFQDYRAYRERVLGSLVGHGLSLGDDLVLVGTVDDAELHEWFQAADAFVFPSTKEGWGLVALEAMSAGLPLVTSDIEVFHEFLTDKENTLMTAVGEPASLADGMMTLQQDSDLVSRLVRNGKRTAQRYTWATSAAAHLQIYNAVVAAQAGSRTPRSGRSDVHRDIPS